MPKMMAVEFLENSQYKEMKKIPFARSLAEFRTPQCPE
jgi:hypothetical protein